MDRQPVRFPGSLREGWIAWRGPGGGSPGASRRADAGCGESRSRRSGGGTLPRGGAMWPRRSSWWRTPRISRQRLAAGRRPTRSPVCARTRSLADSLVGGRSPPAARRATRTGRRPRPSRSLVSGQGPDPRGDVHQPAGRPPGGTGGDRHGRGPSRPGEPRVRAPGRAGPRQHRGAARARPPGRTHLPADRKLWRDCPGGPARRSHHRVGHRPPGRRESDRRPGGVPRAARRRAPNGASSPPQARFPGMPPGAPHLDAPCRRDYAPSWGGGWCWRNRAAATPSSGVGGGEGARQH